MFKRIEFLTHDVPQSIPYWWRPALSPLLCSWLSLQWGRLILTYDVTYKVVRILVLTTMYSILGLVRRVGHMIPVCHRPHVGLRTPWPDVFFLNLFVFVIPWILLTNQHWNPYSVIVDLAYLSLRICDHSYGRGTYSMHQKFQWQSNHHDREWWHTT